MDLGTADCGQMKVDVALIPEEISNKKLEGKTVVAIDVLRATTTVITALQSGCSFIVPVRTLEEAFNKVKELDPPVLIGGEREGKKVPGFDLGNSPGEYTPESVKGKKIIFTTTNGTRILTTIEEGSEPVPTIFICAFVNITAVARELIRGIPEHARPHKEVMIACAGIEGNFSLEDFVCAGALVHRLDDLISKDLKKSEAAEAAEILYHHYQSDLLKLFQRVRGGKSLSTIGLGEDLNFCAQVDVCNLVPKFEKGRIITSKLKLET